MLPIQTYIEHFEQIWENSENDFPEFGRKYATAEQLQREERFGYFQAKMKSFQSKIKPGRIKQRDIVNKFFPMFRSFLETVFDFKKDQLEIILSDNFRNVSKDFYYRARRFDPDLSPENIYQALRNVWIMNGIQLMMDLPVEITPSVFAYSMIYPYSDNLLDDDSISAVDKQIFSQRFNRRLHGENIIPVNHSEGKLFELVRMFEQQFPRNKFPEVFESLYAIQHGQTNSIKLMEINGLQESGIRNICFEKGGASVLADGYLVAGKLNPNQERALFGYGVYLQLLDDIQDIKEDLKTQCRTIFSCTNKDYVDEYVNQAVHFGRTALDEMRCFDNSLTPVFLELMNRSIETMIIESAGLNPESYSENWLRQIQQFSPLRFDFIRNKRSQSKSQRFVLFRKYFDQTQMVTMDEK